MYSIYKLTDPNGLVYIGCTQQSVKARLHGTYNKKLMAAFKKYGIDSFDIDILATTDSAAEAKQLECENIQLYESYNSEKGYNATSFSGYTSTTKNIKDKMFTMRCSDEKLKFIHRASDWYDIIQKMIAFGSIKEIPDIFVFPQHTIVPESHAVSEPEQIIPKERLFCAPPVEKVGISVEDFLAKHPVKNEIPEPQEKDWIGIVGELPNWMLDVINGNFPPPPEENTSVQNKVFDDKEFRDLCKTYQKTHDPELFKVARDIAERCGVEL